MRHSKFIYRICKNQHLPATIFELLPRNGNKHDTIRANQFGYVAAASIKSLSCK